MKRRPRGEGSVYRRKDGSWVAQLNGTYRYAKTEQIAKQKLYKLLAGAEESKPQNVTVAKHLEMYIEAVSHNLKPRTLKRYREAIDTHLKPALGKHKLHNLDAQTIEAVYASKLNAGLSAGSIGLLHAVLSASLKRAVRLRQIEHNVCQDVVKPKVEREEVEVFKTSEVQRILSAANSDPLEALYVLVFSTGVRIGEALALRRGDVDLQAGTLRIARTIYNGVVGTPKSKRSRRTITLPKIAHDALERHIDQVDTDWLFVSRRGQPWWYWTFICDRYKPLLERAGVPYKNIHTARHTVASTLLARGLPISSVARYMGHDERTLLSTYSHLMPDQMDTVAAAMDSALGDGF
jgi:integrase